MHTVTETYFDSEDYSVALEAQFKKYTSLLAIKNPTEEKSSRRAELRTILKNVNGTSENFLGLRALQPHLTSATILLSARILLIAGKNAVAPRRRVGESVRRYFFCYFTLAHLAVCRASYNLVNKFFQ